jgi:6-phosphogluconate dehydrogenase (decarboxylating)
MVRLGRMGGGLAGRLRRAGQDVAGYDPAVAASEVDGLEGLVQAAGGHRARHRGARREQFGGHAVRRHL